MATKYCANALEWWLRNQGKFDGAIVCTQEDSIQNENGVFVGTGYFTITKWVVDGVNQPTDDQVNQIIIDYQADLVDHAAIIAQQKTSIINQFKSLGFTDDQISQFLVK